MNTLGYISISIQFFGANVFHKMEEAGVHEKFDQHYPHYFDLNGLELSISKITKDAKKTKSGWVSIITIHPHDGEILPAEINPLTLVVDIVNWLSENGVEMDCNIQVVENRSVENSFFIGYNAIKSLTPKKEAKA